MTDNARRRSTTVPILLAGALAATAAAVPATAAPANATPATAVPATARPATARPATGRLLPVPAAGPGRQLAVTAVDVSPLGVVAGTARVTSTAPDGTTSTAETPQRWAKVPGAGWLRQRLALPAGAAGGTVDGLTDLGEAAGAVTLGGVSRAARWSVDGRSAALIGEAGSLVTAVGRAGPWGVSTSDGGILSGTADLVRRDGSRTPLRGTPELDAGYRPSVGSIGGPDTALVWVLGGIGRGTSHRPVLWHAGATVRLPVTSMVFLPPACASPVRADGSVVAAGYNIDTGTPRLVLVRHVGGVPGTDIDLFPPAAPGQPSGGIVCTRELQSNVLAADGGVAGYLAGADGRRAAYWSASNVATVVPLDEGERSAAGVAAASGGRMVILAEGDDGSSRLSLWRDGVRTRLSAPAGWTVTSVVELTEAGLLVANVRDAAGTVRPAAWDLAGR